MKNTLIGTVFSALFIFGPAAGRAAPLRTYSDLSDFAYLLRQIGVDRVKVEHMVSPAQNPHFQEPKPSFIIKLSKADLLIEAGLELTKAWLQPVVEQARNRDIVPGGRRHFYAYPGIDILDVPDRKLTRFEGDVHPAGNPHYNYDPQAMLKASENIKNALIAVDPAGAEVYKQTQADWAASYVKDLAGAKKQTDRIGKSPCVVKGLKASGPNKADIIIAKNDADLVRSVARNAKFLSECRVIIVLD